MDTPLSESYSLWRCPKTRATKSKVKGAKATRRRHTEEFKREALGLAEKIGVSEAARELGLHSSQLYGWRSKAELVKTEARLTRNRRRRTRG